MILTPHQTGKTIIQELRNVRVSKVYWTTKWMEKIIKPHSAPQWSEATKQKRQDYKKANKKRFTKRDAQSAL